MQTFVNNIEDFPNLNKIKYITLAGEQLPSALYNTLQKLSNPFIYNGYGPSETTIFSTLTRMENDKITIGRPLDNTIIYILDNNLNPVPIGIPGEIYISGDGVGKGYLNNIELTKKSFLTDINNPNLIMYKSGDIGKYTENGNIVCLGRLDNQIKIRGQRIELDEIENTIKKYPYIKESIIVKHIINNREFLICYFISKKNIEIYNLKKYISGLLPKYMVPSYYVALSSFPYTPNGKLDKKALSIPKELININKTKYVTPETILQKTLVNIYEQILNIKPIGINDNFFELGGDSLLAMNLNMALLKISNKITYQDIFNYPTIAEIEEKIILNNNKKQFSKIENLSEKQLEILQNCRKNAPISTFHPKGVILTGCTGFLGIHILKELIENENCNIYCIIRSKSGISPKPRLLQKLNYYFGNKYDDLIDNRIFVISGDTTKPDFGLKPIDLQNIVNSSDIVINSAAIVSHFGIYEKLYDANVRSVKYITDFCKSYNKKLYHISTISVSGLAMDNAYLSKQSFVHRRNNNKIYFNESNFYIGQDLENIYIRSKFEAENIILDEISNGLDAYILRIGHLMPRFSDGVFQENILDNDLINKIATLINLGNIPDYLLNYPIELTPVDYASLAIYRLISNPSDYNRIFHLYNPYKINVKKLYKLSKTFGFSIKILNDFEFSNKIKGIIQDDENKKNIKNLLYDLDKNYKFNYENNIILSNAFTRRYLKNLKFKWPKITRAYLTKFLEIVRRVV